MIRNVFALLLMLPLLACSTLEFPGVYRLEIEQGNIVTPEMVQQLEPGMSASQVEFILGTPLLRDTFSSDRWDYVYFVRKPDNTTEKQRLTVYYDEGRLAHYESNVKPREELTEPEEPVVPAAQEVDPINEEQPVRPRPGPRR